MGFTCNREQTHLSVSPIDIRRSRFASFPPFFLSRAPSSASGERRAKPAKRAARKNDAALGHANDSFFSPRRASFGDCTHMTAYFVVPTGADIIYTAEYRPEREILACRKIFFRATNGARERRKNTAPGLTPRYINASGGRSSSLLCV